MNCVKRSVQDKWIYRLSASQQVLESHAEKMGSRMKVKLINDAEDQNRGYAAGYAPFISEQRDMYECAAVGRFKSMERQAIVYDIIEEVLQNDSTNQSGSPIIPVKVNDGEFEIMPTHDPDDRQDLRNLWVNNFTSSQPLERIRDYYGEEVAMYFAFLGFYTDCLRVPALLGLVAYVYQIMYGTDNVVMLLWGLFICIWATVFLELWNRRLAQLQVDWDCSHFAKQLGERVGFDGPKQRSPVTGEFVPTFTKGQRMRRYFQTLPVLLFCIVCVLIIALMVVLLHAYMEDQFGEIGAILGGLVNSISIIIMNKIYTSVANWMNNKENHRTQVDFDNAMTAKIFIFQFLSSYMTLFITAFGMDHITLFGYKPICEAAKDTPESCMTEVGSLILYTMISATVVGNSLEVLLPFLLHKREMKNRTKAFEKDGFKPSKHELESLMEELTPIFDEYNEIAIQYGYVLLFACAFPLGPFLAYLNNIIEVHSDAYKMVDIHRRPFYRGAQDIGTWYSIFSLINVAGLITNCALVCFTSKVLEKLGWVDSMLSKIIFFFAAEHVLFLLKFVVADFIPDVSEVTMDSQERLIKKQEKVMDGSKSSKHRKRMVKLANRERFDLISEWITNKLEDGNVMLWRRRRLNSEDIEELVDPHERYMLTRKCDAKLDYEPAMYHYANDDWQRPESDLG